MRGNLGFAFSALVLLVTACGGGGNTTPPPPPAPVVATVAITAPAANNLKIGEAVQFSAVAKDDKGTELTDKTFTWASSDNNLATVAADGKVTAKRFGKVKITATVDGKTGESLEQTTYGLEASGGVSTYKQGGPNDGDLRLALLVRFRNERDIGVVQNETVLRVSGPSGWNNNVVAEVRHGGNGRSWVRWRAGIGSTPLQGGIYQVSANFDGVDYNTSFNVDTNNRILGVTNLRLTAISATSITCAWDAVTGENISYHYDILNDTSNFSFIRAGQTTGTTGTLTGFTLEATPTYRCGVHARNFNSEAQTAVIDPFPAQYNTGFNAIQFGLPVASGPKLTLTIPRGQWAAFRDGEGAWIFQGQPDSAFTKELPVTDAAGRYGIALGYDRFGGVSYQTLTERPTVDGTTYESCSNFNFNRSATIQPSFTLTDQSQNGFVFFQRTEGSNRVFTHSTGRGGSGTVNDITNVVSGAYVWMANQRVLNAQGGVDPRIGATLKRGSLNISSGANPLNLDFSSATSSVITNGTATVGGVPSGFNAYLTTRLGTAAFTMRCANTMLLAFDRSDNPVTTGSYTANRYSVGAGFFQTGDVLRLFAGSSRTTGSLGEEVGQQRILAATATQPTAFTNPTPLTAGSGSLSNGLPQATASDPFPRPAGLYLASFSQTVNNNTTRLELNATRGWLTASPGVTLLAYPDFTGFPSARRNWRFVSGNVDYSINRIDLGSNADLAAYLNNATVADYDYVVRSDRIVNP